MSSNEQAKDQALSLPHSPGVYLYYNNKDTIIYVGKAKDLRKRVLSYFNKVHDNAKTRVLVRNISRIEHLVVETEEDALLLENTLIKKHQPRYNIQLKDDKTYPWICIKNEPFPRVIRTRKVVKDGGVYFGPYPSVYLLDTLLELIKKLYPLRTCKLKLDDSSIASGKYRPCLEYHIGNCKGPCIGEEKQDFYAEYIKQVKNILNGNLKQVKTYTKEKIEMLAAEFRFEEAHEYKRKLDLIEKFQSKSTVVSSSITNVDVFTYLEDLDDVYINFLKVVDGAVLQSYTLSLKKKLEEAPEDILQQAMVEIRMRYSSTAKEIIVPFNPNIEFEGVIFHIPQRGAKKKLLDLSLRNAKYTRLEYIKRSSELNKEQRSLRVLHTLQQDLHLKDLPRHIECFDNSNLQGTNAVAACVVFRNGKPAKKEYRNFLIKTVEGPNDYASMEKVVFRRYKRMLDEEKPLPQLVVVDGGKGQLSSALSALEQLGLRGKLAIIGIAKRLEEIYFPEDSVPLYLDKNSESLRLIQQLRDEAHRFGITFHRKKRDKQTVDSELDHVFGVGDRTKEALLREFGSAQNIKKQSLESLIKVVGRHKGALVYSHFQQG